MRRTNQVGGRDRGLSAALKAVAVVLAVGVLALVAGQSAYRSGDGSQAAQKHQMIEPAPDNAPFVAADSQATDRQAGNPSDNGAPRMLAVAPSGFSPPEMQAEESAKATPAQDEPPVATF
jgi:hypothetical protein